MRRPHISEVRRNQTHCVNGHEFTPENTYIASSKGRNSYRACRKCRANKERARRQGKSKSQLWKVWREEN